MVAIQIQVSKLSEMHYRCRDQKLELELKMVKPFNKSDDALPLLFLKLYSIVLLY